MQINPKHRSALDPAFVPAALWSRAYSEQVARATGSQDLHLAFTRPDGTVFRHATRVLPDTESNRGWNLRYVERLVKFLLWMKGGTRLLVSGPETLVTQLAQIYSPAGGRAFDDETLGRKVFLASGLSVEARKLTEMPDASSTSSASSPRVPR